MKSQALGGREKLTRMTLLHIALLHIDVKLEEGEKKTSKRRPRDLNPKVLSCRDADAQSPYIALIIGLERFRKVRPCQ